jgi:aspartate ammonia-lyase
VGTIAALVPIIGYGRSAELAEDALKLGRKVAELAVERGLVTGEQAVEMLDPIRLASPR